MTGVIVAAAILGDNGLIYSLPAPNRHHNIIEKLSDNYCFSMKQGFLLRSGKFVDRLVAAKMAIESGQIKKLRWPPKLYTEDLW